MQRLRLVLLSIALVGCGHSWLTERERMQLDLRYKGSTFELAQSMWVAPFWRDDSRRLLTRSPPGEVVLMVTPKGAPMLPGDAERVMPAGTKVSVLRVTFPLGWEYATRPLLTPRSNPWVEMVGTGQGTPEYVIVLPPDARTQAMVFQRIADYLTSDPVDEEVAALAPVDRKMIATKELAAGASARGLELAFGPPNFKHIVGDGPNHTEDWTWYSDTTSRTAHLTANVVTSFESHKLPPSEQPR